MTMLCLLGACAKTPVGDAQRGERLFQYCFSCHSIEPGETGLAGPNLGTVLGRPIAAEADFPYSPAMRAFADKEGVWSEALLERYLAAPQKIVHRTVMSFPGIDDGRERADLIAYLRRLREER